VYFNTRGQVAACILTVQLVSPESTTCIYVATCTWPTVRHVYSDRTRGELQVAKNYFFL